MGALDTAVRQGKALYAGISSYSAEQSETAIRILRELRTPCLIHQPSYSIMNRWIEKGLTEVLQRDAVGCIAFCPLAQGLLTDRYLAGIPADSRAAKPSGFLKAKEITSARLEQIRKLRDVALARGQTLAQMALAWVLRDGKVCSALTGASKPSQLAENVAALKNVKFSADELARIDAIAGR